MTYREDIAAILQVIRNEARLHGEFLSRATVYRRAQNRLARYADEARRAGLHMESALMDSAARYCGFRV